MEAHAEFPPIEFIARGVIVHRSHVLLCRNQRKGYFYLPGGHVESGEDSPAALLRELQEEAGLEARVVRPLLVAEVRFGTGKKRHHEVNLVFHVEQSGAPHRGTTPPPVQSRESAIAFEWVERPALAQLDLRPAVIRDWLAAPKDPVSQAAITWMSVSE